MSELPTGWVDIAIGEISDVIAGGTPKANDASNFALPGKGIAWLTPADLSGYKQKEISKGSRDLSQKGYDSCSAKLMPKGSLLFSSRAPIGYVALAANEISTNQGFKSFVFPAEVDPTYAFFFLKSIRELADSLGTGTTFKELSGTTAKTLPFRLAPTNEQIRIAQKLDELLAQVDTLKARIDAIPFLLKRFRQSVLASATSGRLTEEWRAHRISREITAEQTCGDGSFPPDWKVRPLKKLVTKIEQGWSPKCESVSASDDEWAVIKTTAIQPISFGPLENKKLPTTLLPRPELSIVIGDILITRAGPRSRAAVCCYVKATQPKLMVCDKAYRFRAVEEEFSGLLLCYFLNSPQFVRALDDLKTGISESGVNLTMKKFQDLELPQPPTEEQTEIVRRVEQLFAFADQLEAKVASAKSRIDHLTQSILAKAFRGELVPQDPNDEPASVLLKRIKAQRAAAPKAKRGRKVSA
ncbi:restriction endonuclease subunit S [Pseudomonas zeae]|uniref:Restriction endonuclease subunit S n=1 Tax=Pseudomonas zeae TaxID=2745510 RepID=A0ABU5BDS1_9PSED|nr:restriction endonuclease subunit S [Pseudomonas zeae]MDX9674787.1 restriction endonuclease subunit S [Pseudomonas zeae]